MDKLLSMYKSKNMESKQPLLILGCSRKYNIQMDRKVTRCNYVDWVNLEQKLEIRFSPLHEHILYQHTHNPYDGKCNEMCI
jgi:hypothetical protein